jgi:hypothetical protein
MYQIAIITCGEETVIAPMIGDVARPFLCRQNYAKLASIGIVLRVPRLTKGLSRYALVDAGAIDSYDFGALSVGNIIKSGYRVDSPQKIH